MVTCSYCKKNANLVSGEKIYPHRTDLNHLRFWLCEPCSAYVGCHKGSKNTPLGTLATHHLRKLRNEAHSLFDPIWKNNTPGMTRTKAYAQLSEELEIPMSQCHIAMFDEDMCRRTIEICKKSKHYTVGRGNEK